MKKYLIFIQINLFYLFFQNFKKNLKNSKQIVSKIIEKCRKILIKENKLSQINKKFNKKLTNVRNKNQNKQKLRYYKH